MRIFLAENGHKTGPFLPWEVRTRIEHGELTTATLGWHEGCDEWMPLADLPALGLAGRGIDQASIQQQDPADADAEGDGYAASAAAEETGGPQPRLADIRPRPWQRFFARMFDTMLWFALMLVTIKAFGGELKSLLTSPGWVIASQLLLLLAEAACLTLFGRTPGKALLGLSVLAPADGVLRFNLALQRAVGVFVLGNACYLHQYLLIIAWIFHHTMLTRNGSTWWDRRHGLAVDGSPVTLRRVVVFVLAFFALEAVMNLLAGEEMRALLQEMLQTQ